MRDCLSFSFSGRPHVPSQCKLGDDIEANGCTCGREDDLRFAALEKDEDSRGILSCFHLLDITLQKRRTFLL